MSKTVTHFHETITAAYTFSLTASLSYNCHPSFYFHLLIKWSYFYVSAVLMISGETVQPVQAPSAGYYWASFCCVSWLKGLIEKHAAALMESANKELLSGLLNHSASLLWICSAPLAFMFKCHQCINAINVKERFSFWIMWSYNKHFFPMDTQNLCCVTFIQRRLRHSNIFTCNFIFNTFNEADVLSAV